MFPALFTLALVAIVAGVMISIIRVTTIELAFKISWPQEGCMGELWFAEKDYWKNKLDPADLNYGDLADAGRLKAYQEARKDELRPYQFFGNTLLAIVFFSISSIVAIIRRQHESIARLIARIGPWILAIAIATLVLYPASRQSYYRFNKAIDDLAASASRNATYRSGSQPRSTCSKQPQDCSASSPVRRRPSDPSDSKRPNSCSAH